MSLLRVCYPHINNFLSREDGKFAGFTSHILQVYEEILSGINHTFVQEDSFGNMIDRSSHSYDGCIGSMQRNESDVAVLLIVVPIDGPNVTQTLVNGWDQATIISSYKKPDMARRGSGQILSNAALHSDPRDRRQSFQA